MSGVLQLSASGQETLEFPFAEEKLPPALVSSCPKKRSSAPFTVVWGRAMVKSFAEIWGTQAAISALTNPIGSVRISGASELGKLGPQAPEAVPDLTNLLDDDVESVRRAAIEALGLIGPEAKDALGMLTAWLRIRSSSWERRLAAEAIGRIGLATEETLSALLDALDDETFSVREEAARALGLFGPEAAEAVPELIEALGDRYPAVVQAASEALEAITGEAFGPEPALWQQWWSEKQAGGD